jgi:hypothetical protein
LVGGRSAHDAPQPRRQDRAPLPPLAGVEERAIMQLTRHKSVTVARRYIRDGSLFRGNVAGRTGVGGTPDPARGSPPESRRAHEESPDA